MCPQMKALCSKHGVGWSTRKSVPFFFYKPSMTHLYSQNSKLGSLIARGAIVLVRNRLAVVQLHNSNVTMGVRLAGGPLHYPTALPVNSKHPQRQLTFTLADPVSLLLPSDPIGFSVWLQEIRARVWAPLGEDGRFDVLSNRIRLYYAGLDRLAAMQEEAK